MRWVMPEKTTATFVIPASVHYRASRRLRGDFRSRVRIYLVVGVFFLLCYLAAERLPTIWAPIAMQIAGDSGTWVRVLAIRPIVLVFFGLFLGARYALAGVAKQQISERLKPDANPIDFTADGTGVHWSVSGKGSLSLAWAGIERILMVDDYLIFGAGFVSTIVPTAALGPDWKPWLKSVLERLTPEARAASEKELRNVL